LKSYHVRAHADDKIAQFWKELYFVRGWKVISSMLWKYDKLWIYCAQSHVVIFYMRVLLRNMISARLLSLTFRKNRSENIVEYDSKRRSI